MSAYQRALERHYAAAWEPVHLARRGAEGPVHELPPSFEVLVYPPRPGREMWTYATSGMSGGEPGGVEVHLFSPRESDELVELLTVLAHHHANTAPLALHQTIAFGRGWLEGSACEFGLLSAPHIDGPGLESFEHGGARVRCLWLVPITREERDLKRALGVDALEERFEDAGLAYLDPLRASVV